MLLLKQHKIINHTPRCVETEQKDILVPEASMKPLDENVANINGHEKEDDANMMIDLSSDEQEEDEV